MSKEMTPKEAFQSLIEIYDITKSSKQCKIINKALNSVEETKTNYHTALAFCEASKEEKQELYKQIKQLEKENEKQQEMIKEYNHYLASVERKKADLIQENEKYKKVIEILKDKLCLELSKENNELHFDTIECDVIDHDYYDEYLYILTQQEYDLLKEVLE